LPRNVFAEQNAISIAQLVQDDPLVE
jgi:hypothetical protein